MADFNNIQEVNKLLSDAQEVESDNRDTAREVTNFLDKEDGQWDPSIVSTMKDRPRYTFDKCNPIVDSIAGEMEQAEFGIKVRPAGGDASGDTAKFFDGMIRNIQSMSNAEHIFNAAGRNMVRVGFDAWRVVQDWADTDSFEQDLFIRKIANAVDRVWFDPSAEMQDMSDAKYCFVLQALSKSEYEKRFPEGSGKSVCDDNGNQVYYHKADLIMVGELLYKKPITKELVQMNNNAVYEVDEKFEQVQAELEEKGITERRRRKKKSHVVTSRFFDGQMFLSEEKKTVFDFIPVVPTYGNFRITENKVIYRGAIEKLMDPQRSLNFLQSRELEEIALSPRGKYWMTNEQMVSHLDTLQTLNTNANPVQGYTHVDGQPIPQWQGGAQVNQGLQAASQNMSRNIIEGSGIFAANQGNAPQQSGIAIELQQNKGDTSTIKYFDSQEIAICHTARILVNAIPKVYDTKRTVRILGEDGSTKMEAVNDQVLDNKTQEMVSLNDLTQGKYDVVCDVGQAFKNRQLEMQAAFLKAASIDPSLIDIAKDVWLKNMNMVGMDLIAERARKVMLESGQIPDNQMTDEEKEKAQALIEQAQAQPQEPDPMQAAIMEQTQANTADIQSKAQERTDKTQIESEKLRQNELQMTINAQQKADEQDAKDRQQAIDNQMLIINALNTQSDTLNKLREAMGADAVISKGGAEAYKEQTELVEEAQEKVES